MPSIISDRSWVRQAFMAREADRPEDIGYKAQFYSASINMFTDSSPGGDVCINPHPQFTRYADIKPRDADNEFSAQSGMARGQGRYIAEAINMQQQVIQVRCGVPQHNSLNQYFMQFFNPSASRLAKTGRTAGFAASVGRTLAFVTQIVFWPLAGISVLKNTYNALQGKQRSKYYYLKPTMPLYWATAQNILNQILANEGTIPRIGGESGNTKMLGDNYVYTREQLQRFAKLAPDIFSENEPGTVDLFAVATRAQRLARAQELEMQRRLDSESINFVDDVRNFLGAKIVDQSQNKDFSTYWGNWLKTSMAMTLSSEQALAQQITDTTPQTNPDGTPVAPQVPTTTSFTEMVAVTQQEADDMTHWWNAEMNDGSAWIGFRVNNTGEASESFNNTTTQPEILSNINSKSTAARNTRFSLADGNISDDFVSTMIGGAIKTVGDIISGYAEQMSISGIAVMAGAAFVDIPDHYDSSSYQASSSSYTIVLNSPYGNPISRMINLHIPLSCLLALALPRSTGKQSYTSPFIFEYYDKGRSQSRLAICNGLTVRRGGGNTGWTSDFKPLQIEVTLEFKHLDNILHMPVTSGLTIGEVAAGAVSEAAGAAIQKLPADSVASNALTLATGVITNAFSDDTAFTDYMAVLGSMGLADQVYPMRKLRIALTKQAADFQTLTSPARLMAVAAATIPGQLWSIPYAGTIR